MPGCLRNYQVSHSSATAMSFGQGNRVRFSSGKGDSKIQRQSRAVFRLCEEILPSLSCIYRASQDFWRSIQDAGTSVQVSVAALEDCQGQNWSVAEDAASRSSICTSSAPEDRDKVNCSVRPCSHTHADRLTLVHALKNHAVSDLCYLSSKRQQGKAHIAVVPKSPESKAVS